MTNNTQKTRSFFVGNITVCGFFLTLSAIAIYVMVTFPQAGY